jgi:predicted RNA-binding Zn ribbon-like protein
MILAWAAVEEQLPGRLRQCENDECRLFLLDRSHAIERWHSAGVGEDRNLQRGPKKVFIDW